MNDNERTLLRYVVEGDIRKSQQQAKIVLEGLTTVKDKAFKETCLRTLASKSPTLIELPYNLQGLLVAEDLSAFREDRFLIRDDEKAVIEKMCKMRRSDVIDHRMHRVGNRSLRFPERIEPGKVFEHFVNHTCI